MSAGPTPWEADALASAWGDRPSIYEFLASCDDPGCLGLPDEATYQIRAHESGDAFDVAAIAEETKLRARQIVRAIAVVLEDGAEPEALRHLSRLVVRAPLVDVLDDVLGQVVEEQGLAPERLHSLANLLVTKAPDRELLKLGIALLGLVVGCSEREPLVTVGRHEEFTLFAAVALASSLDSPDEALWDLARRTRGWGRIHAVERLAGTADRRIRRWMLCDGYRNRVANEYLALTCAVAGGMSEALAEAEIDQELLDGASGLLSALLSGGPGECLDDLPDAVQVVSDYLRHLAKRSEEAGIGLEHLLSVEQIRVFLVALNPEDEEARIRREAAGWTADRCAEIDRECREVSAWPLWRRLIERDLQADELETFHRADAAAELLGIDAWAAHFERVQSHPRDLLSWLSLLQSEDEQRVLDAVQHARAFFPMDELRGVANDANAHLGQQAERQNLLATVVHGFGQVESGGEELLCDALACPYASVRQAALEAVAMRPELSPELLEAAAKAQARSREER